MGPSPAATQAGADVRGHPGSVFVCFITADAGALLVPGTKTLLRAIHESPVR